MLFSVVLGGDSSVNDDCDDDHSVLNAKGIKREDSLSFVTDRHFYPSLR
jgi:hypothetical protein